MTCPKCRTELPDGSKFCLECGRDLSLKAGHPELGDKALRQWIHHVLITETNDNRFVNFRNRFTDLVIIEALNLTGGNQSRAAKLLSISRTALVGRIRKHGIKLQVNYDHD